MTNTPRRHIYCLAYPEYNFVWSYFLKGEIFLPIQNGYVNPAHGGGS